MKIKSVSALVLLAFGAACMILGFVYHLCDVGFPIPVPHASRFTDEEMRRINPPSDVGDTIFYCGLVIFGAGSVLACFRFGCRFFACKLPEREA